MKILVSLLFLLTSSISWGQSNSFIVNGNTFLIKQKVVPNEWNTNDTINELFRVEADTETYLLKYYVFQDEGGDCNNEFWSRETLDVKRDALLFLTHYFQKTGIDPIPEWRKQIYSVSTDGKLLLTYDKYKYYESEEWVNE